jgi:predicted dehydrogenase
MGLAAFAVTRAGRCAECYSPRIRLEEERVGTEHDGPEPVRIGILGAGRIADLACLGYLDHPRAAIVAVCDVDGARARERAAAWGAPRAYTDSAALFDDPAVDAVEILTPHHLHAEQAIAALRAGKHVSLQKPPTRTLAELDAVAAAAAASGRTLRITENFRYYPPHRKALELIESGAIGVPLSVRVKTAAGHPSRGWKVGLASLGWRMNREACGGGPTTFDHGYHCYQMARLCIPADVERVHAFIHWSRIGPDAWYDGPALISWQYAGSPPRFGSWEVIASLGLAVRSKYYASDDRLEVHGTEGIIWVNRCTGQLLEEPSLVLYREGETRAFHELETDWAESFRLAGRDFVDALLAGRPCFQEVSDARKTLAFALAAAKSADERREVAVGEMG